MTDYPFPPPDQPCPQRDYQRFYPRARVGAGLQATAIVTLILVGAACLEAAGPWVGPADGIRVGVAGDSQVQAAQYGPGLKEPDDPDHHVTDALNAAGYRASVAGTIGSITRDLVKWPAWPQPGAQTVVLAYGANDMNSSATGEPTVPIAEAEANVRGFIERIDPPDDGVDVCVVLVEMPELAVVWGHDVWGSAVECSPGRNRRRGGPVVRPDRGQPRVPRPGPCAPDPRGDGPCTSTPWLPGCKPVPDGVAGDDVVVRVL